MAKKILLADDSLTIQKVVELTFSDSGYELVCVSNGQRALERVREARPDLILADAVMPEKNGYEVCEAIKGDPATARIPVVLLSGTFEPFDRERAERIGADAIVSKPFDSQQLLAQVDALLDRARVDAAGREPRGESMSLTTAAIVIPPLSGPPADPTHSGEEAPFDVGFSSEDFTASVRLPPTRRGIDPFEEEYGRGDVDSAIAAFEKSQPRFGSEVESGSAAAGLADQPLTRGEPVQDPHWLREEPEKNPPSAPARSEPASTPDRDFSSPGSSSQAATVAISRADFPPLPEAETPTLEFPMPAIDRRGAAASSDAEETDPGSPPKSPEPEKDRWSFPAAPEVSGQETEPRVDPYGWDPPYTSTPEQTDAEAPAAEPPPAPPQARAAGAVSGELEMLAQRSSIPELTQMLSNVRGGGEMTDEQMDRLAARVVEKLSERILREIAWEVIPDMAEIVIKRRIKELESGVE